MIAQEVETVLPDWVSTTPEGYKLLAIRGFEALTVEAFRELQASTLHYKPSTMRSKRG